MTPQRGAAAVFLCGLVALAGVLAVGLGRVAAVSVAVARAEAAADAAALAAAHELATGRSEGGARRIAEVIAAANGARLTRCDCRGATATVAVTLALPSVPSFPREAKAVARAEVHTECTV